jgi:hypothetical protein
VTAHAQETRGRVQGTVSDSSGAIVPGASVVLANDDTGIATTRTSNREGGYLFDYVDPGRYTLTVTLAGFNTAVQKNVRVQQRADLTVDVKLAVGGVNETVTVTESPVAVQFNTASRDLTVEQQMVSDLPSFTSNPLQLARLDPTVINRGSTVEVQPYFHRTANEADLGGGTKFRNDVVLDGTPLTAGNKLGYTPPTDAVTEYTVQQNAIDAEFGHNAGTPPPTAPCAGTARTRTGTPGPRSAPRWSRTSCSSSRSSRGSRPPSPRRGPTRFRRRWSARATSRSRSTRTAPCA